MTGQRPAAGGGPPRRMLIGAVAANGGVAVAKIVAFVFTGSASMLAESIHSLADTCNEMLMMWGGRQARRPADDAFSFGYTRERYFWSFMVAVLLFMLGGLYSIFEGVSKLTGNHDVSSPAWAVGVLVVAAVLEGSSLRLAICVSRPHVGKDGWWRFIRTTKSPEAPVVLLEDTAALVGLALALTGLGVTMMTGNPDFDALGSIAIGALLTVIAVVLAVEMKGLLIGESANRQTTELLLAELTAQPEIRRVAELRTQHLGPETILLAAKVVFSPDMTSAETASTIDQIERRIVAAVPSVRYVYLQPVGDEA